MKRVLMVLLVVAVLGSSWWLYSQHREPAVAQLPEGVRTENVVRGDIEAVVSATGSVSPNDTENVSFSVAGTVQGVFAQQDDLVAEGQLLAALDTEDLELRVEQSRAALQVSEAQLARALIAPTAEELASARAAITSAQASLQDLIDGPKWREQQLARLSIDQAKNSLWGAQGSRDAIKGSKMNSGGQKDQAEAQVLNAEVQVKIAELQYQQLFEDPSAGAVAQAQSQLSQAEANLAKLESLPSSEDIAVVEAQVEQARVGLAIAESALADEGLQLKAPTDGYLLEWGVKPGDPASPGAPVGIIVDASRLLIQVDIDETEIGKIAVDQRAHIILDAFPDVAIDGHVTTIDLLGDNVQGIIVYGVEIEIEDTDLPIRPAMTAGVDIIVDSKSDVVLVPNRALRRDAEGTYVEIVENNVLRRRNVEIGVADAEVSEVIAGLDEGQQVVVSRPRDSMFTGPFGGG